MIELICSDCKIPLVKVDRELRCTQCKDLRFKFINGLYLADESETFKVDRTMLQHFMENKYIASIYTNYWRPLGFLNLKGFLSEEKELELLIDSTRKSNASVLDVCCGPGYFTERIADKMPENEVIGVDFSVPMLKEAQKKKNKVSAYLQASAYELPFLSESVDTIICNGALHILESLEDLFIEFGRVLKSGGKFTGFFLKKYSSRLVSDLAGMSSLHYWDEDFVLGLFRSTGFKIEDLSRHHRAIYFRVSKS